MMTRSMLFVVLPPYHTPRNKWRGQIHQAAQDAAKQMHVRFTESDKLEISIELYLSESAILFHDVDNRLKDILDALQGRAGGPKKTRSLAAIIPNDRQVYRVEICKTVSNSNLGGQFIIRRLE